MESIGQILKAARERRQMARSDVVTATKMTNAFVEAIEADNFSVLVAPVYARGFIKLYAVCVGLDPMPLLKQFDASIRAAPVLAPPLSKAQPSKSSVASAGKPKPTRLQQEGLLPIQRTTGKPEQGKAGGRSPAGNPSADGRSIAGRKIAGGAALAPAAPLRVGARAPIPGLRPSWLASLLAWRLPALNWTYISRVQWPRFKLPRRMFPYLPLPVIVWQRIFIVTVVVLLIIAASLAWEWSHRGLPSATDACRWLAEPPAPYLAVDAHPATVSR